VLIFSRLIIVELSAEVAKHILGPCCHLGTETGIVLYLIGSNFEQLIEEVYVHDSTSWTIHSVEHFTRTKRDIQRLLLDKTLASTTAILGEHGS
jgi:hypothetical protein